MADGTGEDGKASTPDGHQPTEINPIAEDKPKESAPETSVVKQPALHTGSEWTASDSRGPLECAEDGALTSASTTDPAAVEPAVQSAAPEQASASSDAEHTPGSVTAAPAPVVQKRSSLPIAASLVIGALIGAGSAAAVYVMYGPGAGAGAGGATGGSQLGALAARVDALEKKPAPATQDVSDLQHSLADLEGKVAALGKASTGTASQPVDFAPVDKKIAALQASVEALKAQSSGDKAVQDKVAALAADVADAKKQSADVQAGLAGVEGQQKLLVGKATAPALAVVADSLVQQVDRGQPYSAQVDALASLGADPTKVALLRQNADTGVPSAKALAAKFAPLAEPISATAHKAPPNAGFVDKLKSGMFGLVSVRSVDDTSGTDLPSRVARIEADLAHDDVADALATWDALPADAKSNGQAWAALAKSHVEAMATARGLQQEAIVALGGKKS